MSQRSLFGQYLSRLAFGMGFTAHGRPLGALIAARHFAPLPAAVAFAEHAGRLGAFPAPGLLAALAPAVADAPHGGPAGALLATRFLAAPAAAVGPAEVSRRLRGRRALGHFAPLAPAVRLATKPGRLSKFVARLFLAANAPAMREAPGQPPALDCPLAPRLFAALAASMRETTHVGTVDVLVAPGLSAALPSAMGNASRAERSLEGPLCALFAARFYAPLAPAVRRASGPGIKGLLATPRILASLAAAVGPAAGSGVLSPLAAS